jgi:hypothetical protein
MRDLGRPPRVEPGCIRLRLEPARIRPLPGRHVPSVTGANRASSRNSVQTAVPLVRTRRGRGVETRGSAGSPTGPTDPVSPPGALRHRDDAPIHVIIMPGFLIPSSSPTYTRLRTAVEAYLESRRVGHRVSVVSMSTMDWLKIALLGNDFTEYLDRAAALVEESVDRDGGPARRRRTVLLGHSAGGWVSRILLGDVPYQGKVYGFKRTVSRLISLGTPHYSKEQYPFGRVKESIAGGPWGADGSVEAFDSSLKFANRYYGTRDVFEPLTDIVCVCGIVDRSPSKGDSILTRVSYAAAAGEYRDGMEGDGVTPECTAWLVSGEGREDDQRRGTISEKRRREEKEEKEEEGEGEEGERERERRKGQEIRHCAHFEYHKFVSVWGPFLVHTTRH